MAEIRLDHARIADHGLRRAFGENAAFRQHVDVLRQTHHRLHDVLDHHNGDATVGDGADGRHHGGELGWIEPGQDFVEQQEARFRRQRAGEFQPLSPRDREASGGLVQQFPEADQPRDLRGRIARRRARAPRQVCADRNVLVHGQPGERPHDLERAGDAAPRQPVWRNAGNVLAAMIDAAAARR